MCSSYAQFRQFTAPAKHINIGISDRLAAREDKFDPTMGPQ